MCCPPIFKYLSSALLPLNTSLSPPLHLLMYHYPPSLPPSLLSPLQMGQMIIEDVIDSYKYILLGFLVSMVVSLIFIAMMRWIAGPMVWLSILGVMGLLSYGRNFSSVRFMDKFKLITGQLNFQASTTATRATRTLRPSPTTTRTPRPTSTRWCAGG